MLSSDKAQTLVKPTMKQEIDNALKNIDISKALGHDGWSSYFFQVSLFHSECGFVQSHMELL